MRILIYGINYTPELIGIGKFTGEMAEWLVSKGHEVRVIAPPPYYPAWRIQKNYRTGYFCEILGDVRVYRCPIWVKQQLTGWQRILHLLSFAASSFPILLKQIAWRPEIVLVIEPSYFCAPAALLVAKLSRAQSWLHIQDFEIDAGFSLGMMPNIAWLRQIVLISEKWLMRRFNRVSTISEAMLTHLYSKGVSLSRTFLFPNWVDVKQIYPLPKHCSLRSHLGFSSADVIVLYAGSIANKQPLELLIRTAERLQADSKLHFIITGEGSKKDLMVQMVQALQLKNVQFLPLFPAEEFNQMLNTADIHVLIQDGALAHLMMPSKLLGMMATGRPTIATAELDSAIASEIDKSESGIVVPPNNLEKLVGAIQYLSHNPHEREVFGQKGRDYAERYLSKEIILNRIHTEVLNPSRTHRSLSKAFKSTKVGDTSQ